MLLPFTTHQIVLLSFVAILAYAAWGDLVRYLIPNRVVVALVLLYPAHLLASPVTPDLTDSLIIAGIAFAACAAMFACGLMGGGDVKLFAAVALWAGPTHIVPVMAATAILGGVLAMVMLSPFGVLLPTPPTALFKPGLRPGRARQSMPYGVAIAGAGLLLAVDLAGR
jgi:prepilin peptidase CpaA